MTSDFPWGGKKELISFLLLTQKDPEKLKNNEIK